MGLCPHNSPWAEKISFFIYTTLDGSPWSKMVKKFPETGKVEDLTPAEIEKQILVKADLPFNAGLTLQQVRDKYWQMWGDPEPTKN